MRNLIAGFILIMILPTAGYAQQGPAASPRPRNVLEPSPEVSTPASNLPPASTEKSSGPAGGKSEAYAACLRATQRFDQQEKAKGNPKPEVTPLSTACEEELKPAAYWRCMEQKAIENVDFNSAHWQCAKQTRMTE